MTAPTWQQLHATKTGQSALLVGDRAQIRHCLHCGLVILAGYDSNIMATLAICDPYTLTPQLEAAAVILGIRTFQARGNPGHYELTSRHVPGYQPPSWVTYKPATEVPVIAAHRCGTPPLSKTPLQLKPDATLAIDYTQPPPF